MIQNGDSDGVVVMKCSNEHGAKTISQYRKFINSFAEYLTLLIGYGMILSKYRRVVVGVKMTTEIFIEKAKSVHGDKYDYSKVVYINVKTNVQIICPLHGIFEQTPDRHLHGRCGCPVCAGNQKCTTADFVKKAQCVHGDKYDYSLTKYINNKTPIEIICPKHGVFKQVPLNHILGNGCPVCANNMVSTTKDFIQKAIAVHGDKYDYSVTEYHNNRTPVKILCSDHGVFEQRPYVHLSGSGCPVCGHISRLAHRNELDIHKKAEQTFLQCYGVSNPMNDPKIREKHRQIVRSKEVNNKRCQTKRENQSFNTSLSEYRLGILLKSVFGEQDVFDNYVSDVYPFRCDYYIKSRDLYIELNAHWSHGGHWYSEFDSDIVESWYSKSKFYQNAAETFSVRDVEKRHIACKNCLNYVVFWKSDLSDAHRWIEQGCPDGQDWLKEYSWLL